MAKKSKPVAAPAPSVLVVAPTKPRREGFPLSARITVVSTANPKRPGTIAASKWPLYDGAKTVADVVAAFVKAGYKKRRAMSAMRWDEARGFVKIG